MRIPCVNKVLIIIIIIIGNIVMVAENFEFSRGKIWGKEYELGAEIGEFVYFFI